MHFCSRLLGLSLMTTDICKTYGYFWINIPVLINSMLVSNQCIFLVCIKNENVRVYHAQTLRWTQVAVKPRKQIDTYRHLFTWATNFEVHQWSFCVGSIISITWDLQLSKTIRLNSEAMVWLKMKIDKTVNHQLPERFLNMPI